VYPVLQVTPLAVLANAVARPKRSSAPETSISSVTVTVTKTVTETVAVAVAVAAAAAVGRVSSS
jgi:hypothetical protein